MPAVGSGALAAAYSVSFPTGAFPAAAIDHPHSFPTNFYDVKCAPGFQCVSRIGIFGHDHDGPFVPGKIDKAKMDSSPRYDGAYEVGCPARGKLDENGNCRDTGHGTLHYCFSAYHYEAGDGSPCDKEDSCRCVRPSANTGDKDHKNKLSVLIDGDELRSGEFDVQPVAKCDDCSQHDCNPTQCNACKENCEYFEKTLAGKKVKGCFEKDAEDPAAPMGKANAERQRSRSGRLYLRGEKVEKMPLKVVPHYDIWALDLAKNKEGVAKTKPMAWHQTLAIPEPLSRAKWIASYKLVAPELQRRLDWMASQAKDNWGPKCQQLDNAEFDCFNPHNPKSKGPFQLGVTQKLEATRDMQAMCMRMQATARKIAYGAPFDTKSRNVKVKCNRDPGTGGNLCSSLNCYTSDKDLQQAMTRLDERNLQCAKATKQVAEEEALNGPPPAKADELGKGGRINPQNLEDLGIKKPAVKAEGEGPPKEADPNETPTTAEAKPEEAHTVEPQQAIDGDPAMGDPNATSAQRVAQKLSQPQVPPGTEGAEMQPPVEGGDMQPDAGVGGDQGGHHPVHGSSMPAATVAALFLSRSSVPGCACRVGGQNQRCSTSSFAGRPRRPWGQTQSEDQIRNTLREFL